MKLILEPRFLFDGSVAPTAHAVGQGDTHHATPTDHASGSAANQAGKAPAYSLPEATPNPNATQILFVDPRVDNWQDLARSVKSNVQVVVINPGRDAIRQIDRALAGRTGLTAINFLAYGSPGEVTIGNAPLDAASVAAHAAEVAAWSEHLATNADIVFWACDVGQGTAGQVLLADLHTLTGAHVTAFDTAVGASGLGGSWVPDVSVGGSIDAPLPFSHDAVAAYDGVLDSAVPTVTFTNAPSSVLQGGSFTETVTLGNSAQNATGSNPFVEVFAPANATEHATLTAALEGGQVLNFLTESISRDASGQLVYHDPLVHDSSGNVETIAAPAGFQAGDHVYVVELPAGTTVGPGQAASAVQLTFSVDAASQLNAHGGLDIAAVGGFNDGGATSRGTSLDGSTVSDAAHGLATSEMNVSLVQERASLAYTTAPNGGELGYIDVTLTTAPTVGSHPLANVVLPIQLPGNAEYTGGIAIAGVGAGSGTATFTPGSGVDGGTLLVGFTSLAAGGATTVRVPFTVAQGSLAPGANQAAGLDPSVQHQATYPTTGTMTTPWDPSTVSISVPTFDSSLGTLDSVGVTLAATVKTNGSIVAQAQVGSNSLFVKSFDVYEDLSILYPGSTTTSITGVSATVFSLTHKIVFNGTSTPLNYTSTTTSATVDVTSPLTTYIGNGVNTVAFPLSASQTESTSIVGGNFTVTLATTASATATIVYDYTLPNGVSYTPVLEIVGESNTTNPSLGSNFLGNPQTAINATVGSVVRMQAYVQVPENSSTTNQNLTISLPSGLQYQNDGSTDFALVSPGGDLNSSNLTGTYASLGQVTEGATAITPSTYDPTAVLPASLISVSGGNPTFSFGTLSNADNSSVPAYIIVQFNAVVTNASGNTAAAHTVLSSTDSINDNVSPAVSVSVVEPALTLTKTVSSVDPSTGAITYNDLITNSGDATAYDAVLSDPLASSNETTITGESTSGGATGLNVTTTAGLDASFTLAPGQSEFITYTVGVRDPTLAVPDATATLTWHSLNPTVTTFDGSTIAAAGGSTGSRTGDGTTTSLGGANDYSVGQTLGFGAISGQVWDTLGPFSTSYGATGDHDTALSGLTVTATGPAPNTGNPITLTTITDANGDYHFSAGEFGAGLVTITLPASGSDGLGSAETLVYSADGSVTANPASASVTLASTAVTGVDFIYQQPDVNPVLTGWGGSGINLRAGSGPVTLETGGVATTASSTPINTLGGDYGGTILTVERYNGSTPGSTPDPVATDVFGGTGLLTLSGGTVSYNGKEVGTYTENTSPQTAGVLTITWASGTQASTIADVVGSLTYSTAASPDSNTAVTIGAVLNDHNTTTYSGTGAGAGSPGYDLGTGGPLNSHVIYATLNLEPATPAISGQVWDTLGPFSTSYGAAGDHDTALSGVTVTAQGTDPNHPGNTITLTTTTDANGDYSFAADSFAAGAVTITLPAAGSHGLGSTETLVYSADGSVTANPANASVTLASTAVTGVNFIYQQPDVNPVLTGWGGSGINVQAGGRPVTLETGGVATGASSTPINTLGGDYGGTVLTVERYNGSTPDPVATDVFGGSGQLTLSGGTVSYDSHTVGSYTEMGGVLTIAWASGTQASTIADVVGSLTYSTAASPASNTAVTIGAVLNDHNTTTYSGAGAGSPGYDLGTGGPLNSEVIYATLNLEPATPAISGQVWDTLGPYSTTYSSANPVGGPIDTPLAGVTVTATGPDPANPTHDVTLTTTTDANGDYSFGPDSFASGPVTVTLPHPGSGGLPGNNALIYNADGSVTSNPATASVSLGSAPVTHVDFGYEPPDTPPVIANWAIGTPVYHNSPVPVGSGATHVTDTPIGELGGNYGGTELVVQRYTGSTPTPNSTDVLTGNGPLSLSNGIVSYGGNTIGHYTETGGKLVITFSNGVTRATVGAVLDHLSYSNTGALNSPVRLGATLYDNNTTQYPGGSPGYDLGTGGPMTSAPVFVTINPAETPYHPPAGGPPSYGNPNTGVVGQILGRAIIPELWLIGSETDHFVLVEQRMVVTLPPSLFVDSDPTAHLSYDAARPDGTPLPDWLTFDPTSLTFYGTPPAAEAGRRINIVITAYDEYNNSASASFSILIGYKPTDLLDLIKGQQPVGGVLTPSEIRHMQLGDAQPVPAPARLANAVPAHHDTAAPAARPVATAPRPAVRAPAGFSGALRSAGQMGGLGRARAILDALESLAKTRPAS